MRRRAPLLLLLAALAAGGLGYLALRGSGRSSSTTVAPRGSPPTTTPASGAVPLAAPGSRDRPRPAQTASGSAARLVDLAGAPLEGVEVRARGGAVATSRSDGRLVLPAGTRAAPGLLADGWTAVAAGELVDPERGAELTFVLAPTRTVAGTVVDRAGAPVRARVRAVLAPELFDAAPLRPDGSLDVVGEADLAGRFTLADVPAVRGAVLLVTRHGYEPARVALDGRPAEALRVVLALRPERRVRPGEVRVHGRVVDAAGAGVADAKVLLGEAETLSGEDGAFALPAAYAAGAPPLVATRAGLAPAVRERYGTEVVRALQDGSELAAEVLVLDEPAGSITGTLVDPAGVPLTGWTADLLDALWMGPAPDAPSAEELAAGRPHEQRTGTDGGFRFDGLRPAHAYRVRAWEPGTLRCVTSAPTAPGGDELRLRVAEELRPRVHGVVRGRDGTPVPGVAVTLALATGENGGSPRLLAGPRVTTDAEGGFEFTLVPENDLWLTCEGARIVAARFPLAAADPGTHVSLFVARLARFRYEGEGGAYAPTAIAVLDGDEAVLPLLRGGRAPLEDGRSPVLSVSEDARWLAVYRGGDEIDRISLRLVPGEVTVVGK